MPRDELEAEYERLFSIIRQALALLGRDPHLEPAGPDDLLPRLKARLAPPADK